jgi:NAD(P) transhydrogenase
VAVIERGDVGGVCVNTGTIPSKSMREAVVYLHRCEPARTLRHQLPGKDRITWTDLHVRTERVINREIDVIRWQLKRNGIELYTGQGRFIDEHTVLVESPNRGEHITLGGQYVVIATGTTPARPAGVQFDEECVIDSDGILNLRSIPSSMVVVGAGVTGAEYASIFAALGTKGTVVDKRDTMLDFRDQDIVDDLRFYLREQCVTLRLGEEVTTVDIGKEGTVTTLASGKKIAAETVMYSAGRQGCAEQLDLANAGLQADSRGRIVVDDQYQTKVDHVYAVGDVIGFPALASTSMEQGRLAAHHAFGETVNRLTDYQPIGIYTIPELSYVGATESELTKNSIPYEFGVSRYGELARGQIAGNWYGMLKLLVSPEDHKLLGGAHLRHQCHRTRAYRASAHGLWRHGRIPRRRGVQLPNVRRNIQDRRA